LLVAACGRFDFDPRPPPGPDQSVLRCGAPARFTAGVGLQGLNAGATSTGFAVVGVDSTRDLRGWTYDWIGGSLRPRAQDISLAADATSTTGLAVVGDDIIVVSLYGGIAPLGTRLQPLDTDLSSRAPASSRQGVMAGEGPISLGGGGVGDLAMVN